MARMLFEKKGRAVWISHLDLMRVFQRAFKRAGLQLKHTQGYNPRPSVSIALPLSVGVDSCCELLDFDLEGVVPENTRIKEMLNCALIEGVRVLDVYDDGRKLRDLALLSCCVRLEYDAGVPENAVAEISKLYERDSLVVSKKGKNGPVEQDIIPMIRSVEVEEEDGYTVSVKALICCQNPSMNPIQLAQAVQLYMPDLKPDHYTCSRLEIYDGKQKIFR